MRQAEARPASCAAFGRSARGAMRARCRWCTEGWPSVPVPSITTNTRFGAAARHALLAGIKCCPLIGAFLLYWSPRPGAHRRAFFDSGGGGHADVRGLGGRDGVKVWGWLG